MKKTLLLIISIVLCLSFAVGCSTPQESGANDSTYYDAEYATDANKETLTLAENGVTDYKIIISKDASELVEYAAKELKLYFDLATGANIQIATDEGLVYSENEGKYLSLGDTAVKTATGVVASFDELDRDGFVIKTVGDDYVMCGGGDYGTLYAAYEFLHIAFNWETYAADEIYWENTTKAEVEKLDFKDVPSFKNRTGGYFEGRTDAYFTAKLRTFANYGLGLFGEDLWGIWGHSNSRIMNADGLAAGTATVYSKTKYPQFYGNEQLCFTADGIVEAFAGNLAEYVWQYPNQLYFMIGNLDNNNYCTCPNCLAYDKRYNSDEDGVNNRARSVLTMEFFNNACKEVNKLVRDKFVAEYGKEEGNKKADVRLNEIRLVTFAYLFTLEPPVEYNSTTGEYEPMKNVKSLSVEETTGDDYDFTVKEVKYKIIEGETISMTTTEDNSMIMIAPLGGMIDYYHPIEDDKYNAKIQFIVDGWKKVSPRVVVYLYGNNFNTYAEWFDDFSSLPENYALCAELGTEAGWAFSENSSGVKGSVSFQALRSYVYSKLQWDTSLDVNELIDDFMLNYYKVAAPYVKEYFEYCRVYYATKMHDGEIAGTNTGKMILTTGFGAELNDYATVLQMCDILNKGIEAIENSSYSEYQKVKLINRIKMETITIRKTLLTYYYDNIADSVYVELVDGYVEDCKILEIYGRPDSAWDEERESLLAKKGIIA